MYSRRELRQTVKRIGGYDMAKDVLQKLEAMVETVKENTDE